VCVIAICHCEEYWADCFRSDFQSIDTMVSSPRTTPDTWTHVLWPMKFLEIGSNIKFLILAEILGTEGSVAYKPIE
jgi:hypothetical protein